MKWNDEDYICSLDRLPAHFREAGFLLVVNFYGLRSWQANLVKELFHAS